MPGAPAYEVRQKVYGLLNGTFHAAIVVEVGVDAVRGEYLYYVRYVEQDSRMDRWLTANELKERYQGRIHQQQQQLTHSASGGVTTRRQSIAAERAGTDTVPSPSSSVVNGAGAKGGLLQHLEKMPTLRARKDSSFFSRTKNIHSICMGPYEVETWYFSPYHLARPVVQQRLQAASQYYAGNTELQLLSSGPGVGAGGPATAGSSASVSTSTSGPVPSPPPGSPPGSSAVPARRPIATKSFTLHICPYCLQPYTDHEAVIRHVRQDCLRHPPGNEIYRDPVRQLVVLELDGKLEPTFCENLALLSKLFLEHKALDHDMTPFLFYVLCSIQPHGLEVLGYFSKEKQTPEMYNLSCILVLPQFQSRGIGRFLIELSYELSRREGKVGTPEKPLSDLGEKLYLGYWSDAVVTALARALEEGHCTTIDYLVQATSLTQTDVIRTLQHLRLINGNQLCISEESIERCYTKRLHREREVQNYTFYTHLLSWSPGMYEEFKMEPPPPTYVPWRESIDDEMGNAIAADPSPGTVNTTE